MSGEVFRNTVHVSDPESGNSQWFYPGDVCPEWAEGIVDPNNFTSSVSPEPVGETADYGKLNKTELQELLEERGLDVNGKRDDLIQRLKDHDESLG